MAQKQTTYSKTHVLIDSRDRKAGTPSEYYLELQPKLRNVVKIRFNTFNGGAFPYTFREDIIYTFRVGTMYFGQPWTFSDVQIKIPKGMYTLRDLMDLMNSYFYSARIRFEYSEIDRRVTISKVLYWFDIIQLSVQAVSQTGQNVMVDTLLGFPRGWALAPENTFFGVRSSYAVQPQFLPDTLMITFSNFPSKVVSSSGIIGELAIPYSARNFDLMSNRISWSENHEFESEIECYAEYINHLGIRIVDSRTGEKYMFMEEHTLQIEVTHGDTMDAKPYPNPEGFMEIL